ncbi:hypothetical protein [Mesorhizobium sp. SP-1A]|uniref:hypothetical protein n=1 Tax=Mesorhizobium sp. SP-1A TaxID=3077840 RepID=UPI0028F6CD74|nr:hypothetical protein [Mesorhizobium sp. SP-1A]
MADVDPSGESHRRRRCDGSAIRRIAQKKIEENDRAEDLQAAYASGLMIVLERLTFHLNVSRDDALTATGIDKDKLDSVYRKALEGAQFAHDLAKSETESAQREGFQTSFGYIALGHLYRLRWLETQVSGRKARRSSRRHRED